MSDDLTHASFFSGVGGLDMGLERAGWRTVSFSEIDPYASAVLAQRWPGVQNLGDITTLARQRYQGGDGPSWMEQPEGGRFGYADLWTGGFPCQDLSVAGKRRGMGAGTRSGLAYSFLALAERHRPRFVLLENVPGLLSSHGGRDMAALVGALVELGYGVGYRVLDARHFGVPQRRRRVFILGVSPGGRAGAERAAEVLSVGSRCPGHPPTGSEAGEGAAAGARSGVGVVAGLRARDWKGLGFDVEVSGQLVPSVGPSPDSDGMRASDGLARGPHDRDGVAEPQFVTENQRGEVRLTDTSFGLNQEGGKPGQGYAAVLGVSGVIASDPLLPFGLDSHRYRCCGNGVVSDVAFWIGERLAAMA